MFRKALNEAIAITGKQENLASTLGITPATLSRKINGESGWHEEEINKIFELAGDANEVLKAQLEYIEALEKKVL